MTDARIQAAIDRYEYFLTDLYHERLNPDHEENPDHRYGNDWLDGNDWLEAGGWCSSCGSWRGSV
jgi:hypothetical protein